MEKTFVPFGAAMRRYIVELCLAMLCYFVVLCVSLHLVHRMAPGWPKILVAVAPALPIALLFVVFARSYARLDEMWKRICLEAAALAGGTTAVIMVACAFLENAGLPKVPGFTTFILLIWLTWLYAMILKRRY
jgi:hypothetical protein